MTLFKNYYSRYTHIFHKLIEASTSSSIDKHFITKYVSLHGFLETPLILTPKILDPNQKDSFPLLKKLPDSKKYNSILKNRPSSFLTNLEMKWLKNILTDSKINLFLSSKTQSKLNNELKNIDSLFPSEHFERLDTALDSDSVENEVYQKHFWKIKEGILNKEVLYIEYQSGNDKSLVGFFAPLRIEYSLRDDKFRLKCLKISSGGKTTFHRLNLARITYIKNTDENFNESYFKRLNKTKNSNPLEIEIHNFRNGFERTFIQLSQYKKSSWYDEENNVCHMSIDYDPVDEMDLLITMLSFGPIIKVKSPEKFKSMYISRIKQQIDMLNQEIITN